MGDAMVTVWMAVLMVVGCSDGMFWNTGCLCPPPPPPCLVRTCPIEPQCPPPPKCGASLYDSYVEDIPVQPPQQVYSQPYPQPPMIIPPSPHLQPRTQTFNSLIQQPGLNYVSSQGPSSYSNEGSHPSYSNQGPPSYANQGPPSYSNQGPPSYSNEPIPTFPPPTESVPIYELPPPIVDSTAQIDSYPVYTDDETAVLDSGYQESAGGSLEREDDDIYEDILAQITPSAVITDSSRQENGVDWMPYEVFDRRNILLERMKKRNQHASKTYSMSPTTCNNHKLAQLMAQAMVLDVGESKRLVMEAIESAFNGAKFDVICAQGDFSYTVHSRRYCESTKGTVTCFAFR